MSIFKRLDPIQRAYRRLRGYCMKKETCSYCRFVDEDGDCIFKLTIPADWPKERRPNHEHDAGGSD